MRPGRQPPAWRMPREAAQAVGEMRAEVERLTRKKLHPLALRLPLPPESEVEAMEQQLRESGWFGDLLWINDRLVDGRIRLWCWRRLGRQFATIPTDCQRSYSQATEVTALQFFLFNLGRRTKEFGWTRWRRAVAAAVFAPDVNARLVELRAQVSSTKIHPMCYDLLSELCQVPTRYIPYALRLSTRSDRNGFAAALRGEDQGPNRKDLQQAPSYGRNRGVKAHRTSQIETEFKDSINLFLFDFDHPATMRLPIDWLWAMRHPAHSYLVILGQCADVLAGTFERTLVDRFFLQAASGKTDHGRLCYIGRALAEVTEEDSPRRHPVMHWRAVVVYALAQTAMLPPLFREAGIGANATATDKDQCRRRVYEQLMRTFCKRGFHKVFVLHRAHHAENGPIPPHENKTSIMMNVAAGNAGVQLCQFTEAVSGPNDSTPPAKKKGSPRARKKVPRKKPSPALPPTQP